MPTDIHAPRSQILPALLTTAAVFLTALGGLALTPHTGRVASVWLANGVVLLALLRRPLRRWPLWLACGLIGNLAANLAAGDASAAAVVLSGANVLEIALAGAVMRSRCGAGPVDLHRLRTFSWFVASGGLLAPAVSAALAGWVVHAGGALPFWTVFRIWFSADALGNLILVPLAHGLTWGKVQEAFRNHRPAVLLCLATGLLSSLLVATGHAHWLFLLTPLFLAVVFAAGFPGASAALFLATLSGVAALTFRPATAGSSAQVQATLEYLQCFIFTKILVCLPIASLLAERQRAAERMRVISVAIDQSPVTVAITDPSGAIEYVNPKFTELTGYGPAEVLGQNPRILKSGEQPEEVYRELWETILAGRTWRGEFHNRRKDGTRFWESATIAPVKDAAGTITHFVAIKEDITARKHGEQTIRRLNESLERRVAERTAELEAFSYSVSHDLRAPLRTITGFARVLQEDFGPSLDPEAHRLLDRVCQGAQKMAQLIEDLLKLSRVSQGELDFQPIDLSALARRILADLAARDGHRAVRTVVAPGLRAVGDPRLVAIALENLLGNAWKYTARTEQADIRFTAQDQDGERTLVVADNGAGFDMAYAERLFAPFHRMHSPREFEGTGIGLAIVQRIVHRHGGRIWAEAEPDRGATFRFTLPEAV